MESGAEPRRKGVLSGCLWKGPLGCFAFSLGLGVVLSALLPYACGKVSERELEAKFAKSFEGSLMIERAHLGAVVGEQGFYGVRLFDPEGVEVVKGHMTFPSIGKLVSEGKGAEPVRLRLERVELREVRLANGVAVTNLNLALERRGRLRSSTGEGALIARPGSDEREAAADDFDRAGPGIAIGRGHRNALDSDTAVSIGVTDETLTIRGGDGLTFAGSVDRLRWSEASGAALLSGEDYVLEGSFEESGDIGKLRLRIKGPLYLAQQPETSSELVVEVLYETTSAGELAAWPDALVVELLGPASPDGSAAGAPDEELIRALERALASLAGTRFERVDGSPRWLLGSTR